MAKVKFQQDLYQRDNRVVTSASIATAIEGPTAFAQVNVENGQAKFSFTLPRGATGPTGAQGPVGPTGADAPPVQADWDATSGYGEILNKPFYRDTKAHWDAQTTLISKAGAYYIYTDYRTYTKDGQTVTVPGLKIGDGTSYLIDMPFLMGNDDILVDHINNTNIHITAAERAFWNDKVTAFMSQQSQETLILTKDNVL